MSTPKQTVHARLAEIQKTVRRDGRLPDCQDIANLYWLLRLAQKHYEPGWETAAAQAATSATSREVGEA